MDHLGRGFTRMLHEPPSPDSENTNFQHGQNHPQSQFPPHLPQFQFGQNIPPSQFSQNIQAAQFTQNIPPPQFMPNMNPYGAPYNFQQYGSPSFHSAQYQGRYVHSPANFGGAGSSMGRQDGQPCSIWPTDDDIQRLLHIGQARGFPGMLGSLDCMHWHWQNCPVAWQGQYTRGDQKVPTIMLEAVASADRWIWHAFFGSPGSNNDINVLNQSPLFTNVLQGRAPEVKFTANGTEYNMGYYLADGIYPEWATFVKTIPMPQSTKHKLFAQKQESARKDVECAFGILQKRWAIIREPARLWEQEELADIMYACIILHNMIVEDERDNYQLQLDETYEEGRSSRPIVGLGQGALHGFSRVLEINAAIHNSEMHHQLKADLIEHIWQRFGHET